MEIGTKKEKNFVIVSLSGRMDAVSAPDFDKTVANLIADGQHNIIVNLSDVDYISSAGLRSILVTARQLKEKQGKILLAGLKNSVKDVFQMSGFYSIFSILESVEDALSQI
jgi:anti-anti-sigma factor